MKNTRLTRLFISIALVLALLTMAVLVGCSSTAATTSAAATTTSKTTVAASPTLTPISGGTLRILQQGDPTSLGYPPKMSGQQDGNTSGVCLETLFVFDKTGSLAPLLATAWTADPAAKTITLTLRQGVKFQDGSDFNADICKWNMEQYKSGGRPELNKVASIDIVNPYTIRLNLSTFDNTIIASLANGSDAGRMISKQSFDANGGADWAIKNPVGTGPFSFVSWTKSVGLNWKRFDGYWGGKPYLDGIQGKEYADSTAALLDFQAGNLDTILGLTPLQGQTMVAEGKFNVLITPDGGVPALAGYALDPSSPFADIRVRQALSYAVDTTTLAASFGLGYYKPMNQWAVPGTWGYNTSVVGYPYNPQKAKDLLAAAGYPSGLKTTLNFFNQTQSRTDECMAIQAQLKQAGIDATLNPLLRPAFVDMASGGKGWSGIVREEGLSNADPLIKYAGTAGGSEFKGVYLSSEFKDTYNQATAASDFATKQKLVQQLMSIATDKDCMATYLYLQGSPVAKVKNLHDDLYGEVSFFYISPKAWLSK